MLGIMPGEQYREKSATAPGDRLCFYTDGLIERATKSARRSAPTG